MLRCNVLREFLKNSQSMELPLPVWGSIYRGVHLSLDLVARLFLRRGLTGMHLSRSTPSILGKLIWKGRQRGLTHQMTVHEVMKTVMVTFTPSPTCQTYCGVTPFSKPKKPLVLGHTFCIDADASRLDAMSGATRVSCVSNTYFWVHSA